MPTRREALAPPRRAGCVRMELHEENPFQHRNGAARWRRDGVRDAVAFAAVVAVLLVGALATYAAVREQAEAGGWVAHTQEVLARVADLTASYAAHESAMRERERAPATPADPARVAAARVRRDLAALTTLTRDNPPQQARLAQLAARLEPRLASDDAAMTAPAGGAATPRSARDPGGVNESELSAVVAAVRDEERRLLDARVARWTAATRQAAAAVVISTGIALALLFILRALARRNARSIVEARDRLATTLASIGDAVIATDAQGRVERMNGVAERLTQWPEADARGRPIDEVLVLEDESSGERVAVPLAAVLADARHTELPPGVVLVGRERARFAIEDSAAPIRDAFGAVQGAVLVFRDVTARRRAAQELRERQAEFAFALESGGMGVWHWHLGSQRSRWNRQEFELFGARPTSDGWVDTQAFFAPMVQEDRPAVEAAIARAVRDDVDFEAEFRIDHPTRGRRWIAGRGRCLGPPAPDGSRTMIGLNWDVTQQREAEERLRQANDTLARHAEELERQVQQRTRALSEANVELQAFAHSVAHDLRAPLRNVQGYATALLEDEAGRLSEQGQLYAQRMADAAVTLDHLISDLLAYSRLSRADLVREPVDLEAVVRSTLRELAEEVDRTGATVEVRSPLPMASGHRAVLSQVVTNLVSNALKFVAPGTHPHVLIEGRREGDRVVLVVADDGIGIDPRFHDRIFGVFERLHGAERYPGTGIGLAIVRRGVERLGGRVRVESGPGTGSRFVVELPAGDAQSLTPDRSAAEPAPAIRLPGPGPERTFAEARR